MYIKTVAEMVKNGESVTAMRAYYLLMKKYGVRYSEKNQNAYDNELQKLHRLSDKQGLNWAQVTINANHIVKFCEDNKSIISKTCYAKKAAKKAA